MPVANFVLLPYPITYTRHTQESMVSERAVIEERLRKKQSEVASLEEKLKAAKVYVAALNDILRMLAKDDEPPADTVEAKLRPGSAVAQTREIILANGAPVHLDDILEAMGKSVTRDTKASLAGSLAAYVRKEEIFSRPAPNTFGLIELGHTEVFDEEEEQPPAGFGSDNNPLDYDDDVPF